MQEINFESLFNGILKGSRVHLSRAITMVESRRDEHRIIGQQLVEAIVKRGTKALRIGVSGSPGAGKSTFIEAIGLHAISKGHKVAVLTVDPSSEITKGSILGDKTRMEQLSLSEYAFIRPNPTGGHLGGVTRHTRESILLCEAAGYDIVFIETVGVGQSEYAVHSMTDCFVLIQLPGGGDELQGIKKGIVEISDFIIINKAESDRATIANESKAAFINALKLIGHSDSGWDPMVNLCSSLTGEGIPEIWEGIQSYYKWIQNNGYLTRMRNDQSKHWIRDMVLERFTESIEKILDDNHLYEKVNQGVVSPYKAAEILLEDFSKSDQSG